MVIFALLRVNVKRKVPSTYLRRFKFHKSISIFRFWREKDVATFNEINNYVDEDIS